MEPEQSSPVVASAAAKPITGRLSPILFLLGVIFFFLPFVDIRCNNVSLQQVSGINLATGFKIKTPHDGSLFENMDHTNNDFSITKNGETRELNGYALSGLITGIAGLIISLLHFKGREMLGMITGIGAAAALVGLMADIKSQVKIDLSAKTD
ncbi:MAG: hypothetical protein JWM28_3166, partial [Chitinophagaceae bacterium]|nr:hypothetical protein [Chitinophagaceae bacterium]